MFWFKVQLWKELLSRKGRCAIYISLRRNKATPILDIKPRFGKKEAPVHVRGNAKQSYDGIGMYHTERFPEISGCRFMIIILGGNYR